MGSGFIRSMLPSRCRARRRRARIRASRWRYARAIRRRRSTGIEWAASHTPQKILDLVESNGLNVTAFRHNREHNFGTTLGDILPTLTGQRE